MNKVEREKIIEIILKREQLRPIQRLNRLLHDPFRAIPYYILATIAHIRPFKKTFPTLWDTTMTCYLPEGNTFYYYGYCEANLTNFFLRYVQPGMICIDVGAHVGIYTLLLSELVGLDGHIHSFEPTPWTFKLLQQNSRTLANVQNNNCAVAEGDRTLTFADYGPGYGAYNSAHKDGAPALQTKPHMTKVQSISLDKYCTQYPFTPDVIKIDSEGFESEVLKGAKDILGKQKSRPIISIEVANAKEWSQNQNDAFAILDENNYILYQIQPDGYLSALSDDVNYQYDNLICIPQERVTELKPFMI